METYSQGSFRIGTTVRPIAQEEYDLDFVVDFGDRSPNHSVDKTLQQVFDAISASKVHRPKTELKTRCVRVTYENEFHVDILPGIPDPNRNGEDLLVPDRELRCWTPSSPKGYALWFDSVAKEQTIRTRLEKAFAAEPIPPDPNISQKAPLKIAVQLLKRRRDLMLAGDEWKPSSILLTTLLAYQYEDELSPFASLKHSVSQLSIRLINEEAATFRVLNPTNEEEDFTDKWEDREAAYTSLKTMINRFARELTELELKTDLQGVSSALEELFGETVTRKALREQAEYVRKAKDSESLRFSYGGATSNRVRQNTFYGD